MTAAVTWTVAARPCGHAQAGTARGDGLPHLALHWPVGTAPRCGTCQELVYGFDVQAAAGARVRRKTVVVTDAAVRGAGEPCGASDVLAGQP